MSVPEPTFILRSRESPVSALCPLPSGQEILLGHTDGSLSLWSFATRRCCGPAVPAHARPVTEISTGAADGPVLSQGRDGRILAWTAEGEDRFREGRLLASCSEVSFCRLELWRAHNEPDLPWRVAFVAADDASISVLRLAACGPAAPCAALAPARELGSCMALSALAPTRLAAGFESGHVALFCLLQRAELARLRPFTEPVMALAASPAAPCLCAASVGRRVLFFDLKEDALHEARAVDVTNEGVAAVAWRQDGRLLALCGWDRRVRVMAASGARTLAVLTTHRSRLVGAKFTAGGRLCASDESGGTSVWDLYPT